MKEERLSDIYWAGLVCSVCIWLYPALALQNTELSPWLTIPFSLAVAACLGVLSWAGVGLAISIILVNAAGW